MDWHGLKVSGKQLTFPDYKYVYTRMKIFFWNIDTTNIVVKIINMIISKTSMLISALGNKHVFIQHYVVDRVDDAQGQAIKPRRAVAVWVWSPSAEP